MALIAKLYHIEETARKENLTSAARQELRQQNAKPILEKIHKCLTEAKPPPKSAISKAITYALNQWDYLIRYLEHGEAEIDNNLVENQIRPFALGRKIGYSLGIKKRLQLPRSFIA